MKRWLCLVLFGCALALMANAQSLPAAPQTATTPEETPQLIEAKNLSTRVVNLYQQRRLDEALPLAKRALELRETALGRDHPLVGEALNNLGAIYLGKRKYGDAESAYKRVLAIYEKQYGAESPKLCNALENFGWVYVETREADKAEDLLQRSLMIKEKTFGEESLEVGQCLVLIARFYQLLNWHQKAAPHYQRAFSIAEKRADIRAEELITLANLCADALTRAGQMQEADVYRKRAAAINEKMRGSASTSASLPRLEKLATQAIRRVEPVYPPDARSERISGSVVIEVLVSETGNVLKATAISGHPMFKRAGEAAALQWTFKPTLVDGKPTKVVGTITFNFNI